MAHITFVENRGKTVFWHAVAKVLSSAGHQVSWIVQNPAYSPAGRGKDDLVHVMPFPDGLAQDSGMDQNIDAVHAGDRGQAYFDSTFSHYSHYQKQIQNILRSDSPDLIIGEATLFHEMLTIESSRDIGIPYLHPCANRYPAGRFSLFQYDTQLPVMGSKEQWPEDSARDLVGRLVHGHEILHYMRPLSGLEKLNRRYGQFLAHTQTWWGRLQGERYNTPSLLKKIALSIALHRNLQCWSRLAKCPGPGDKALLYPLQMQPEANIDIWGRPYSNQVDVVRRMLAAAPANVKIAVKANPKSKYEVSVELLKLASEDERVCLLPLEMRMSEAQALTIGALTVTGTVGFEAVVGKGRCISLRHPLIESEFPSHHANSVEAAVQRLLAEPLAGVGDLQSGVRLIQLLVAQSFPGLVSDPIYQPECIESGNAQLIASALEKFLYERPAMLDSK